MGVITDPIGDMRRAREAANEAAHRSLGSDLWRPWPSAHKTRATLRLSEFGIHVTVPPGSAGGIA
jgi:hypothetical protein